MAKGQKRTSREAKKPKTAIKPLHPTAAPTFLKPGPATATPAGGSVRSGKR